MSGQTFDQMSGLTFASFPEGTNGQKYPDEEQATEIEKSFREDPQLRAMCPKCKAVGEGTFEQLVLHIETCDATG